MKNVLRTAFFGTMLVGLVVHTTGCVVTDCGDNDPNTTCYETPTEYVGDPVPMSTSYTAGQNIVIRTNNGNFASEKNDIVVERGGQPDEVSAVFQPVVFLSSNMEEEAARQMSERLELVATSDGEVLIGAAKLEGSADGLGCGIHVTLPEGYDGAITIEIDNGDVDAELSGGLPTATTVLAGNAFAIAVNGAAGPLDIRSNGDITVSVQEWSAEDGTVYSDGTGDISFFAPDGANGQIDALAGDAGLGVSVDPSLPEGWTETSSASAYDKSFELGDGLGGTVSITTEFGYGEIHLGEQN